MQQVPEHYLGVWKRRLISYQNGEIDQHTSVYWLQTPRLFADLRIPTDMPAHSISHADRLALCEQKGFAGVTQVDGDICQWHRHIDFQPASNEADIGRMHFETRDRLIETALDDDYYEIWERLADSKGLCRSQCLQANDNPTRSACLVLAGDYFLFAADRHAPLAPNGHLRERIDSENRQALLACELSFGQHRAGAMPWHIDYSTLPAQIGQRLLPASVEPLADDLFSHAMGYFAPTNGWKLASDPSPKR
ncbi:hypothetical protein FQ186_09225 [Pseudomonas sp. ANT_H14]|uniref:hypothetical protein n=1 Tax=unclassified Pseudomonas TaxID=196821 RepID=UPI0011EEF143|nr:MULTISPECIES: hypothetical protein [unclassified Pseudomonas]KAA0950398.1 hypothetical protein FQ182_01315 [Pseudomonas sp. ANT_H4]KAA0952866.1 hypothetical protein FQ186_09225 [Pseudomonas sp. ANT_H14]